jgi:hypothetical protein
LADQPVPPPEGHQEQGQFYPAPQPLTVDYARRRIRMHYVAESELDALASAGNSLNFVFFGASFGGFVSFFSVLESTNIPDIGPHATFVMLTILFLILSIFFGWKGLQDYRLASRKLKELKESGTGE